MKCAGCGKAVPKKGKMRYHAICWDLELQRRKEELIVQDVENKLMNRAVRTTPGPAWFRPSSWRRSRSFVLSRRLRRLR